MCRIIIVTGVTMGKNLLSLKGKYSVKKHVSVSKESAVLSGYSVRFDDDGKEVE